MGLHARRCWLLLWAVVLAACALPPPLPGSSEAELRRAWGEPTDTHPGPDGARRLEYASGPYGRTTWMIDVDRSGRVQGAVQVLTPERLYALPLGLDEAALRREMGRPGEVRGVHGGGRTWLWRFETNDCLMLVASLSNAGRLGGVAVMPDPGCDANSDAYS